MKLGVVSYVLLALLPTAYASVQVVLNDDPNCKGTVLSSHTLAVEDGCQTFGVGKAQGASLSRVLPVGGADERELETDTLLFYSSPDCNSTSGDIIASTDSGCIAIGGKFKTQQFQSFRIVSPEMSKAGERMGWKENNAALLRHGLTWADLENQGDGMHGRLFVTGGKVYRYHQLSSSTWQGVSLEDWDEDVHVRHDEV